MQGLLGLPIKELKCDGVKDCPHRVSHIDEKGFIYCKQCGFARKQSVRCRTMTPRELIQIKSNQPLERY